MSTQTLPTLDATRGRRRERLSASSGSSWRPDIQGLRAVAVIAVVLNHTVGWPSGGFVGVDIFFVISGFVITRLLLKENATSARIDIPAFLRRRIKRIVPTAALVIGTTLAVSATLSSTSRHAAIIDDASWAARLLANWHFAAVGTDYFQASSPPSPLQHFWSLAVEEQFYVVWPVMLVIAAVPFAASRDARFRRLVGVVAGVVTIASLVWSIVDTGSSPTTAYFSTFTRAWEISAGALVAAAAPLFASIGRRLRGVIGWIGLGAIVACLGVISDAWSFPGAAALLPVTATALVIIAGTGGDIPGTRFLRHRLTTIVGGASYALYLWHFPVIVFADDVIGDDSLRPIVVFAASAALTITTVLLLERPLLSSPWLAGAMSGQNRRAAWHAWASRVMPGLRRSALIHATVACVFVVAAAVASEAMPSPHSSSAIAQIAPPPGDAVTNADPADTGPGPQGAAQANLTAALSAALTTSTWPTLTTSEKSGVGGVDAPPAVAKCSDASSAANCTWGAGSAGKRAFLVGDSTSLAYTQAFIDSARMEGSDTRVSAFGMFGCSFIDITYADSDSSRVDNCREQKSRTIAAIEEARPDVVVITNLLVLGTHSSSGARVTVDEYKAGLESIIARIAKSAKQVVILPALPTEADVEQCYTPRSVPSDCTTTVTDLYKELFEATKSVAMTTRATLLDPRPLGCVADRCPAFVGDVLVKSDLNHITVAFAHRIAPTLRTLFEPLGLFDLVS